MNHLFLRKAADEDIDLLFRWANDSAVRKNSFNSNHIAYEAHRAWFNNILNTDDIIQYIMMDGNIPVGQIRLNIENDDAIISYSIALEYRGKGYGHAIIRLAEDEIKTKHTNIKRMVANVKPDNIASNKLFIDEGFELSFMCYSYNIRDEKENDCY